MNNEAATARFVAIIDECSEALDAITTLVNDHFGVHPDTLHWGHVGEAGRVRDLLRQALDAARGER